MTQQLVQNFQKWRGEAYKGVDPEMLLLAQNGQNPDHIVINCVDSRVSPALILGTKAGQCFNFTAMGAIVRPHQPGTNLSATLQFSIEHMKVPSIVLMGHTKCGAIKALVEDIEDPEINSFVSVARAGLEKAKSQNPNSHEGLLRMTEREVTLQSRENLLTYPAVQKATNEGRLKITTWMFDLEEGNLYEFNSVSGAFENITHFDPPQTSHDHNDCGCHPR